MAKKPRARQTTKTAAGRTAEGKFAPGNGGGGARPGAGRKPKAIREAEAELWKDHPDAAAKFIRRLVELASSRSEKVAFAACREGLRRLFGRERMTIDIASNEAQQIELVSGEVRAEVAAKVATIAAQAVRKEMPR